LVEKEPTLLVEGEHTIELQIKMTLLDLMGLGNSQNQDPKFAHADWRAVEERLASHTLEAKSLHGITYPLNLALSNARTPVPAIIVRKLITAHRDALTEESFGAACRHSHTSAPVMKALLDSDPSLASPENIRRWDLDWLATNQNEPVAQIIVEVCPGALPTTNNDWIEMRPSSHSFWLKVLLNMRSNVISESSVKQLGLMQYFVANGNVDAVRLLLHKYPSLLQHKTGNALPLHLALEQGHMYANEPWHNRAPIIKVLLELGLQQNVGGEGGCGGLYTKYQNKTALDFSIDALSCAWEDEERKECLKVCIQVASSYMRGLPTPDYEEPLLSAAIGILPKQTIQLMMKKYPIQINDMDRFGKTAIFRVIELATQIPRNGIPVTKTIYLNRKRENDALLERETLRRFARPEMNEALEEDDLEEDRLFPRRGREIEWEMRMRRVRHRERELAIENDQGGARDMRIHLRDRQNRDGEHNHLLQRLISETRETRDDEILEREIEKEYFFNTMKFLLGKTDDTKTSSSVSCACLKDKTSRYPLHEATEKGIALSEGLENILSSNFDAVREPDGLTGLHPFMLAAAEPKSNLNSVFHLLQQDPSCIPGGCGKVQEGYLKASMCCFS
jgi:hypothetical protein